jgi:hypothetical protein
MKDWKDGRLDNGFQTSILPGVAPMRLARWIFLIAGIYGVLVIAPLYFLEEQIGRDSPPAITHPEIYYLFVGVTLAWQIAFLVISTNPVRLRSIMLPAILEKASAIAVLVLFAQGRVPALNLGFAIIDLVLGGLFLLAYVKTGGEKYV